MTDLYKLVMDLPLEKRKLLALRLKSHRDAALASLRSTSSKRLTAYIVVNKEPVPTVSELRNFLLEELPEYMLPSAFVVLDALPLTPNGKVDRRALPAPGRARHELSTTLASPRTSVEKVLLEIWSAVLGVGQVGIHDNFFELGGDSILSLQIIARANQAGLKLSPKQLFQNQTIAELAAVAEASGEVKAEQGVLSGAVQFTPIQRWFFDQHIKRPNHFNQSVLLEAAKPISAGTLRKAVAALINHHDMLRLRLNIEATEEAGYLASQQDDVVVVVDLTEVGQRSLQHVMQRAGEQLQASLNLEQGPVVRVGVFDADGSSSVMIVIHHLAVDGVSWRILLDDLQSAYDQAARGATVGLGSKTSSYRQWVQALESYSQREQVRQEASYWEGDRWLTVKPLPVDLQGENSAGSIEVQQVRLTEDETARLLREVPEAYHTRIEEVLVAALVAALNKWTGEREVKIEMEGHGREEVEEGIDVTRTVGWFTTLYPVLIELGPGEGIEGIIGRVKEEMSRVPGKGISYGVMRYLGGEEAAERMRRGGEAEISFNYLGQFDQVLRESQTWEVTGGGIGREQGEDESRNHLIEVNGLVAGGQLQMSFSYSRNCHRRETMARVADGFIEELRGLINHCLTLKSKAYGSSDFSLIQMDEKRLDELIEQIDFEA